MKYDTGSEQGRTTNVERKMTKESIETKRENIKGRRKLKPKFAKREKKRGEREDYKIYVCVFEKESLSKNKEIETERCK